MALQSGANFQKYLSNIQEALSYLYKHSIFGDVTIQAVSPRDGSSLCFSAHKLVLAIRSAFFADMLCKEIPNNNRILSVNISPRIMDILLWYIYSDKVEGDDIDELIESSKMAVKYEVHGFHIQCAKRLQELSMSINENNVLSVLKIANVSRSDNLREKCFQFIENEPGKVLLSEDFASACDATVLKIVQTSNFNVSPQTVLKNVINWMVFNKKSDRKFLSNIDFSAFRVDDFLNVVEAFPNFFSSEEINSIESSLMHSEPLNFPSWGTFSKTEKRTDREISKLLYEGMELIKKSAVKLRTDCSQKISRCTFLSMKSFELEVLMKICTRCNAFELVMIELAFGFAYVPVSNLTIELCSNIGVRKKMQAVKYILIPSIDNYYLILCNNLVSETDKNFNVLLKVKAVKLDAWGVHGPTSNQKYRVASVPDLTDIRLQSPGFIQIANVKPFSESVLFIDPRSGEKKFLVSALFFDTEKNMEKYLQYVK